MSILRLYELLNLGVLQAPNSLSEALMFFSGKSWDLQSAWNVAVSTATSHNVGNMMNFSPSPLKGRFRPHRRL